MPNACLRSAKRCCKGPYTDVCVTFSQDRVPMRAFVFTTVCFIHMEEICDMNMLWKPPEKRKKQAHVRTMRTYGSPTEGDHKNYQNLGPCAREARIAECPCTLSKSRFALARVRQACACSLRARRRAGWRSTVCSTIHSFHVTPTLPQSLSKSETLAPRSFLP